MCCVLFVGTFRINIPFTLIFLGLIFLFACKYPRGCPAQMMRYRLILYPTKLVLAAADFSVPSATTPADLLHIEKLLKIGGGFGLISCICGWYLTLLTVCEAVGIPNPLPVFDLSTRVFPSKNNRAKDA